MRTRRQTRSGATMVEFAIVGSITFIILFAILIFCLGIFRYQQVARLSRDASRWASVHGTDYAKDTGNSAATAADVYNNAIKPGAQGLDLNKITYTVTWNSSNSPTHTDASGNAVANTVTVTVKYQWLPEAIFGQATLQSTSTSVMNY